MKSNTVLSYAIIGALLTTIVNPISCQDAQPLSWGQQVSQKLSEKTPGILKEAGAGLKKLLQPTIDKLTDKVTEAIGSLTSKIKNQGPTVIIPMLQDALKNLGTQIGTVSACMLGKNGCSTKERAAFIGTAIIVLALTAILIGYTVTVAATSKEVDIEVTRISQEVQGWGPKAVFTRLNNTVNDFKYSLDGMKTCLTSQACTKNQKQVLYATAATIAALATIAMGIGVGSFIYAEKEKAKEAETSRILEQITTPLAELPGDATTPEPEKKTSFIPSFTLPDFDALGSSLNQKLSSWQQKIQAQLPVIDTQSLQAAYATIKNGVMTGAIQLKDMTADLINKAIKSTKQFPALLQETLGIDLAQLKTTFSDFKTNTTELTTLITDPVKYQLGTFADQIEGVLNYFKNLAQRAKGAKEAWEQLSKLKLLKAKITSSTAFKKQKEALDTENRKLQEERQQTLDTKKRAAIEEKQKELNTRYETLVKMEIFDAFASPERIKKLYPEMVETINTLRLDIAGAFAEKLLFALSKLIGLSQSIHENAGKIGAIIADPEIDQALVNLKAGIERLGVHINNVISVKPLIVTNQLDLTDLIKTVLKALGGDLFDYLEKNKDHIKDTVTSIRALTNLIMPIKASLELFTKHLNNLGSKTKTEFLDKLRANPVMGIANSPALLRSALADAIKATKVTFNEILSRTTELLNQAAIVIPAGFNLLTDLNDRIKEITGQPFINPQALSNAIPIMTVDFPNIAEGTKGLIRTIKTINVELKP